MRLPRMTAEGSGFYPCLYFRAKARKNVYPACFEAPGDHLSPAPDAIIVHLLPRHFDHNPLATAPEAKAKRPVAKTMRRASPFSMYDSDGPNAFRLITTSAGTRERTNRVTPIAIPLTIAMLFFISYFSTRMFGMSLVGAVILLPGR